MPLPTDIEEDDPGHVAGHNATNVDVNTNSANIATLLGRVPSDPVLKSLYDANSILAADANDTPHVLVVAASTFVGRQSTGDIAALTVAQAKTLLALVKADVGLESVDNTTDTGKPVSTAQQTAFDGKQPLDSDLTTIAGLDSATAGVLSTDGAGWLRKSYAQIKTALGLDSVDNTPDTAKPVSTAQQTALDAKLPLATFDANTILKADTDNTPSALVIPASSIVGRLAAGGIGALSTSDVLTLLGRTDEDVQDLVGGMVTGNTETGITVTYDDSGGKLNFVADGGGGAGSGFWGDGSDGAMVLDGTNTYAAAFTKSGSTYTAIRDVLATTFSVSSGVTVVMSGFVLYAATSVTNAGTIHNNGVNGANQNGAAGGVQGNVGAAGQTGGTSTTTTGGNTANQAACLGGVGGAGGTAAGGAAGTVGTVAMAAYPTFRALPTFLTGWTMNGGTSPIRFTSGNGGGGGAGSGTLTGGGGGGGGGGVIIASPTITNTGTISANGGNGFSPSNANTGGGGGGGGGCVRLFSRATVTGTVAATGGTGGTGNGTGGNGANGGAGNVYQLIAA